MPMTPEAKSKLSKVVRGTQNANSGGLRKTLIDELKSKTTSVYRLNIKGIKNSDLDETNEAKRRRLQEWLDEQVRCETGENKRTSEDFLKQAVKQAAYTLLNRIVILKLMEGMGLRSYKVLTGGWNSPGYKDYRSLGPALVRDKVDRSEGYGFLLQLIFEELATDLPGLFGSGGVADLIPIPESLLKTVVEAFDDPELESCWSDDMTLGWVYQYWNDPEREAIDAKLNAGGKVEPHEIASKTQMFTERYMVDWLLQNSLGPMWLAMCRKHGWTPDCESEGTLAALEERRVEWRAKREERQAAVAAQGLKQAEDSDYTFNEDELPGVSLTELMPLETDAERRWAYYVPQPIPDDAIEHAPESVRELKILDPAVGSGHFLVVAFDLLVALYKEEASHRGESHGDEWTDAAIVERILEHNLHGIDLDPRAVQIAAAALWLKAQKTCQIAQPTQINLVASNLGIASLSDEDPALVELRRVVQEETGIPASLTNGIVEALRGAEHLGSLLKIDDAISNAIQEFEESLGFKDKVDRVLFGDDGTMLIQSGGIDRAASARGILAAMEHFLDRHTSADELGLRLHGRQLASGVRFLRMVREDVFDVVVGNPPYQGTSKMENKDYVDAEYKLGKADLFAAFLLRGLQLVRPYGVSAMLTMRKWMFIKQYLKLREHLMNNFDLRALGDFSVGAFDEVPNDVLSVVVSVFRKIAPCKDNAVALQPTPPHDASYDRQRTRRKRAATLCHTGCNEFASKALESVPEWPVIYWWTSEFLHQYAAAPKVGEVFPARSGAQTSDDVRFLRLPFEVRDQAWEECESNSELTWAPYIPGAAGLEWVEPLVKVIRWYRSGIEVKVFNEKLYKSHSRTVKNEDSYFVKGVAFSTIGSHFSARIHRYASVFGSMGASVFAPDSRKALCTLNSSIIGEIIQSLNPGMHFTSGDVNRLPIWVPQDSDAVTSEIETAFGVSESHRETSVEFICPGPSPWRAAQLWAQRAVDRRQGEPLVDYVAEFDPEPATDHISYAVGVALGRFGGNGEGIIDPQTHDLDSALPHGILFLDGTLTDGDLRDSLGHEAANVIHSNWELYGPSIASNVGIRKWLRTKFFRDVHKTMYENRPIHWPLSSAKKTFVAWVNIHRWNERTLTNLLALLNSALRRIDGELTDLRAVRDSNDKDAARRANEGYDDLRAWQQELEEFISNVQQCAEKGPLSPEVAPGNKQCPPRECDAPYDPTLDDGVMINSAALWPLLNPMWKDPKKWWEQLASANPRGNKDYDWSQLAMKYWPERVDGKCKKDPSLAVAHRCFWKYHPAKAWKWELRLQDEIDSDFRIEEASCRGDGGDREHRADYLNAEPAAALVTVEKELTRRRGKKDNIRIIDQMTLLEPGLWSAMPEKCWDIETMFIKKQKAPFRLLAPDEAESRAALLEEKPALRKQRNELLNKVSPVDMFAGEEV